MVRSLVIVETGELSPDRSPIVRGGIVSQHDDFAVLHFIMRALDAVEEIHCNLVFGLRLKDSRKPDFVDEVGILQLLDGAGLCVAEHPETRLIAFAVENVLEILALVSVGQCDENRIGAWREIENGGKLHILDDIGGVIALQVSDGGLFV